MAIIYNKHSKYVAADSKIRVELNDNGIYFRRAEDQNLTLNSIWNEIPIDSVEIDSVSLPFTKLNFSFQHPFKTGDKVVVYHTPNPFQPTAGAQSYNGNYTVVESFNDNGQNEHYVVVDMVVTTPFNISDATIANTIKVSSSENPYNFNLTPLLKNKVESSIQNVSTNYDGSSNVFDYRYLMGKDYTPQYDIKGIAFESGNVSFILEASNTQVDTDLKIGDEIFITLDDRIWDYDDNLFDSGTLGFTSSNTHYIREGLKIFSNGQITEPSYNGEHFVDSILSQASIRTTTPFINSTPAEGGKIIYQPYPEWNKKRVKITGRSTFNGDATLITDLPWIQNDPNVTGTITKFGDKKESIKDEETDYQLLLNSTFDYKDFSSDQMDEYVIKNLSIPLNIDTNDNNIATIRNLPNERLKYSLISKEAKEHILIYNDSDIDNLVIDFLDRDKNLLGELEYSYNFPLNSRYFPISIKDLLTQSETVVLGNPLSQIQDDVYYYEVKLKGTTNKAVYFPDDTNTFNRQLVTDTQFLMPQNGNSETQWSSYILMDLSEIQSGSSQTYHVITIDDMIISLDYDSVNSNIPIVNVDNPSGAGNTQFNLDTTYTEDSDGSLFLLYISRDEATGDHTIGLTNRSYLDFPDVTQKLTGETYGGVISLGNIPVGLNPTITTQPFIGTIYWFNIYDTLTKATLSTFDDKFGGATSPNTWYAYDENNTDQMADLYSWWDFNEGEIWQSGTYQKFADRYDSLSSVGNLIDMVDSGKVATPAVKDNLTNDNRDGILSNKTLYKVDKRCERWLNPYNLSFVDSLGSLTSIPFKMKNKEFIESSKSSYYKETDLSSDTDIKKGGDTTYHNKSRSSYELTTDLYTPTIDSNTEIKDLLRSTEVYLQKGDDLIGVTVDTDSIEIKDIDDSVWSYTIRVVENIDNHRS